MIPPYFRLSYITQIRKGNSGNGFALSNSKALNP